MPPIRQKKRGQAPDRNKAIQEEVAKLVEAQIIREVHYHSWLSNPVMIPLQVFLDAYKGYHQIQMVEKDEEKMAFHTSQRVYYYTKMPFDLKNVEVTYQQLVDNAFERQVGRNLEGFMEDVGNKIEEVGDLVQRIMGHGVGNASVTQSHMASRVLINLSLSSVTSSLSSDASTAMNDKATSFGESTPSFVSMMKTNSELLGLVDGGSISASSMAGSFKSSKDTSTKAMHDGGNVLPEKPDEDSPPAEIQVEEEIQESWTLFTDESSCLEGSVVGLILTNPEGMKFTYALRFEFEASNNEVKYEALVAGLQIVEQIEPWLRCVGPLQVEYVVREIHEGSCLMHSGPRSVVAKAIRFGLQGEIISDNGKQFKDNPSKDWCDKLNIKQKFASIKHPQTNGLVKRANRILGEDIKARLDRGNKD
ncbi:reverse transcriptase domain-containing protein [Tanacetum coccineum]|uniref:Reverse transcriptase domain-containing protein n=1 Tax=Tanacetum coccineum TaxID=301880 RepID=A0ABQ5IY60_9ASTR